MTAGTGSKADRVDYFQYEKKINIKIQFLLRVIAN